MISDLLFESISLSDLEELVAKGTAENRRLDFKRTIDLSSRQAQVELLRDIVGFANSEGGLLVYGVREGEGDDAGIAVGIEGIAGSADDLMLEIGNLLRDNVDERITGVLQRPISISKRAFVHLIKVPASHLAPHMIANIRTSSPRFFARANTSNEPMTARQIKDLARRQDSAVDRAANRIALRVEILRNEASLRKNPFTGEQGPANQAIIHFAPLFAPSGGWGYEDPAVGTRLLAVRMFGYQPSFQLEYSQHGAFQRSIAQRHIGFLREGDFEGQAYDVVEARQNFQGPSFFASDFEQAVAAAFEDAASLARDGFLPPPCLCQTHLLGVTGSRFVATPAWHSSTNQVITDNEVRTEPFLISDWSEKDRVMRQLLDHVWQAWGFSRCGHYDEAGRLMRFNPDGHRITLSTHSAV